MVLRARVRDGLAEVTSKGTEAWEAQPLRYRQREPEREGII